MTNQATKFVLGVLAAAVVAFAGVTIANDDHTSAVLFLGLALTACAVAIGMGRSVGADLPPTGDGGASTPIDPADAARGSYGPIIVGIAAFLLVLGGALGPDYVIGSVVVALIGVTLWVFDSVRPELDPRSATNVDNRLLGPLGLPVFAFLAAISIAYCFSRVLLAVSETASWVTAFIVAAVLLTTLSVIASRRPSSRLLAGVSAVGVVVTLIAGGAGAGAGEREFHHHESETPIVEISAKDTAFDRNVIGLPGDTDVELIFTNFDLGTFHNVAIYTEGEPGEPVYNGKPIAKKSAIYKFKTPDPGTYRYVCDFHPTMVGELRLTVAAASGHEAMGHE
jgi:plastocyanin